MIENKVGCGDLQPSQIAVSGGSRLRRTREVKLPVDQAADTFDDALEINGLSWKVARHSE
jgi:hypothetical protein